MPEAIPRRHLVQPARFPLATCGGGARRGAGRVPRWPAAPRGERAPCRSAAGGRGTAAAPTALRRLVPLLRSVSE